MDSKITPDSIAQWEASKEILSTAYELEYIADTWPKRLPIEDLIILQSFGQYNGFNTWKTVLLHAVNTDEIPAQTEHWFSGDVEPSGFWTGKKPKTVLIPPCQKHQGDNIAFFSSELVTKCTVSPIDFAEYLKQQDEKPSKYIAAWFDAFGVDREPEPDSPLETDKTGDETESNTYKERKNWFNKWIDNQGIDINALTVEQIHSQIKQCHRRDKIWNITIETFKREFWQTYSKEHGIRKKSGRPTKR
jgi:hypothetical protein